jgi:hypothetical protein
VAALLRTWSRNLDLAAVRELGDADLCILANEVGPTLMGRLCRLGDDDFRAQIRSSVARDHLTAFDQAAATPIPAATYFEAIRLVLRATSVVTRGCRRLISVAVATAASHLEDAHSRIRTLLKTDLWSRSLTGTERAAVETILVSLRSAHGELWMKGGIEVRARDDVANTFDGTKSLFQSQRLDALSRQELTAALEEITEAGRLLGIDLLL